MLLERVTISNYKSLRSIDLSPTPFSVFVGTNGSGKSNFADALDFLAKAYADGLEHAVARKGGYENIAHRKERRSRSAISFSIELSDWFKDSDLTVGQQGQGARTGSSEKTSRIKFIHRFSIKTAGEGIRSEFKVVSESLELIQNAFDEKLTASASYEWLRIERGKDGRVELQGDLTSKLAQAVFFNAAVWNQEQSLDLVLAPTELIFSFPLIRPRVVRRFTSWLTQFSIFQFSPDASRHDGVPTPNPSLSTQGDNLPAVIDWLQAKRPREWRLVLAGMREIAPELEDISVDYLHTRTLGLFFKESGIGRPWSAQEVSDGTIRSLAMLVACFDPRTSALILEEPENSLHPWIIRNIIGHLRKLSKSKLVIVTTHSPIVLNVVDPNEVWVVYKKHGETAIQSLLSFDATLESDWAAGKYRLFDYIESGVLSETVPSGAK